MYLRLSTECQSILSADMATDIRPIWRPTLGRYVGRGSVNTIGRYVGRHSADMLRSTVASVSVDSRWGIGRQSVRYRSTVNHCFAEIAAISLPTGDAKEESIAYARVLIERGCSLNCRHFEYICNATSRQALSRKRRDSQEHIPECPIDGKKQSIDRY